MKVYNYKKAKEAIEKYKPLGLKFAMLGMNEDWGWTGETIWAEGKYLEDLNKNTTIAGIEGSTWATPVLKLDFEDHILTMNCYTNE
jgi:hypothetical protein